MDFIVKRFDSVGSTNDEALKLARSGAAEGACVVASEQTAGRGRHGRIWSSVRNAGLYASVVLRPTIDPQMLSLITLAAGIAVHDTLEAFGASPDIKWVNDVLVKDKKAAGILAEAVETPIGLAVVLGIGINLSSDALPAELAATSTSLSDIAGGRVVAAEVEATLFTQLDRVYAILCGDDGPRKIVEEWSGRSTYFMGKQVRATVGNEIFQGVTDGLEPNGALRVIRDDGSTSVVQAGEVERLRSAED